MRHWFFVVAIAFAVAAFFLSPHRVRSQGPIIPPGYNVETNQDWWEVCDPTTITPYQPGFYPDETLKLVPIPAQSKGAFRLFNPTEFGNPFYYLKYVAPPAPYYGEPAYENTGVQCVWDAYVDSLGAAGGVKQARTPEKTFIHPVEYGDVSFAYSFHDFFPLYTLFWRDYRIVVLWNDGFATKVEGYINLESGSGDSQYKTGYISHSIEPRSGRYIAAVWVEFDTMNIGGLPDWAEGLPAPKLYIDRPLIRGFYRTATPTVTPTPTATPTPTVVPTTPPSQPCKIRFDLWSFEPKNLYNWYRVSPSGILDVVQSSGVPALRTQMSAALAQIDVRRDANFVLRPGNIYRDAASSTTVTYWYRLQFSDGSEWYPWASGTAYFNFWLTGLAIPQEHIGKTVSYVEIRVNKAGGTAYIDTRQFYVESWDYCGSTPPTPTGTPPTVTATYVPTWTPTPTKTPPTYLTATPTPTPSPSVTPGGPTLTPAPTWTPKPTWTPIPTWTPAPTWTAQPTPTGCVVCPATCTPEPTWTPKPTWTPIPTWTPGPFPTATNPLPTWTPGPTWTPAPTWTPDIPPTSLPEPTWTPGPTWTPVPTWTPDIQATVPAGPTWTPAPTWTPPPTWTPIPTWTPSAISITVVISGTTGGGSTPDDWGDSGLGFWDVIGLIVTKVFDFLLALLQPITDIISFLLWLLRFLLELISKLLTPLWWVFEFIVTLIVGLGNAAMNAPPVAPLEIGNYGIGFNFVTNILSSTPFGVFTTILNALLWFNFIRWAIGQFSNL
jgi:hypothetical protein